VITLGDHVITPSVHVITTGDRVIGLPAVKCSGTTLNERLSIAYGLQAASVMKMVLTGRGKSSVSKLKNTLNNAHSIPELSVGIPLSSNPLLTILADVTNRLS